MMRSLDGFGVTNALHYRCRAPLFGKGHRHEDRFHISYIFNGQSRVEIDSRQFEVGPKDCIFVRPGVLHASLGDARTDYDLLEIKFSAATNRHENLIPPIETVFRVHDVGSLVPALERLVSAHLVSGGEENWLSRVRLAEVLMLMHKATATGPTVENVDSDVLRKVRQAGDYIAVNYAKPITVERLAEMAFMSASHFSACFKEVMEVSPIEYLIRTRLGRARELLQDSGFTVSQISRICGFRSPHYFSRLFHRRQGVSPGVFRASATSGSTAARVGADRPLH